MTYNASTAPRSWPSIERMIPAVRLQNHISPEICKVTNRNDGCYFLCFILQFEGEVAFNFKMSELTQLLGRVPVDKEIYVSATVMDWYLLENHTGFAICVVKSNKTSMKLLGDQHRVFIPGFPVSVYVSTAILSVHTCISCDV